MLSIYLTNKIVYSLAVNEQPIEGQGARDDLYLTGIEHAVRVLIATPATWAPA
jgi:hypothetical protein